jgi:hypothetical protein
MRDFLPIVVVVFYSHCLLLGSLGCLPKQATLKSQRDQALFFFATALAGALAGTLAFVFGATFAIDFTAAAFVGTFFAAAFSAAVIGTFFFTGVFGFAAIFDLHYYWGRSPMSVYLHGMALISIVMCNGLYSLPDIRNYITQLALYICLSFMHGNCNERGGCD